MPTLTVPTEYVNKLKELGVYDQWLHNVIEQWDGYCRLNPSNGLYNDYIHTMQSTDCTYKISAFISCSFSWDKTYEKFNFWLDVALKLCQTLK